MNLFSALFFIFTYFSLTVGEPSIVTFHIPVNLLNIKNQFHGPTQHLAEQGLPQSAQQPFNDALPLSDGSTPFDDLSLYYALPLNDARPFNDDSPSKDDLKTHFALPPNNARPLTDHSPSYEALTPHFALPANNARPLNDDSPSSDALLPHFALPPNNARPLTDDSPSYEAFTPHFALPPNNARPLNDVLPLHRGLPLNDEINDAVLVKNTLLLNRAQPIGKVHAYKYNERFYVSKN